MARQNKGKGRKGLYAPLGRRGLRREVRAATNLAYRPQERAIGGEIRASRQREGELGDWWNNYLQTVNRGRAETQAAYDRAAGASQAQVAQSSALDTAATRKLNEEEARSAATRGAPTSTAGAQRETAAQAQRNWLSAAQGGALATTGANQYAYLTEQRRIGEGQKIASRREEQKRGISLRQERRDVRKERGSYAATKRGELRDTERAYIQQLRELGLSKRQLRAEEQQAAADAALAWTQEARLASEGAVSARQAQERIGISRRGAGTGGLTPTQRRAVKRGKQNASVEAANLYRSAKKPPKTAADWAAFTSLVASMEGIDPVDAKRAVARLRRRVNPALNALPAGR